jgi:hypothetical protein
MANVPGPTSFKKGQSGNPKGRNKEFPWFREQCRQRTPEALAVLDGVMRGRVYFESEDGTKYQRVPKVRDRLKAAETLLAYGWGRPPQSVTGEGGEGEAAIVVTIGGADAKL